VAQQTEILTKLRPAESSAEEKEVGVDGKQAGALIATSEEDGKEDEIRRAVFEILREYAQAH